MTFLVIGYYFSIFSTSLSTISRPEAPLGRQIRKQGGQLLDVKSFPKKSLRFLQVVPSPMRRIIW
jgi:hypothetical protein